MKVLFLPPPLLSRVFLCGSAPPAPGAINNFLSFLILPFESPRESVPLNDRRYRGGMGDLAVSPASLQRVCWRRVEPRSFLLPLPPPPPTHPPGRPPPLSELWISDALRFLPSSVPYPPRTYLHILSPEISLPSPASAVTSDDLDPQSDHRTRTFLALAAESPIKI